MTNKMVSIATLGRRDAPGGSIEEPHAKVRLELHDPLADRGAGQPKLVRSRREAAGLHDSRENLHAHQLIHVPPLCQNGVDNTVTRMAIIKALKPANVCAAKGIDDRLLPHGERRCVGSWLANGRYCCTTKN